MRLLSLFDCKNRVGGDERAGHRAERRLVLIRGRLGVGLADHDERAIQQPTFWRGEWFPVFVDQFACGCRSDGAVTEIFLLKQDEGRIVIRRLRLARNRTLRRFDSSFREAWNAQRLSAFDRHANAARQMANEPIVCVGRQQSGRPHDIPADAATVDPIRPDAPFIVAMGQTKLLERRYDARIRFCELLGKSGLRVGADPGRQFDIDNDRCGLFGDEVKKVRQTLTDRGVRVLPHFLGGAVNPDDDDPILQIMPAHGVDAHGCVFAGDLYPLEEADFLQWLYDAEHDRCGYDNACGPRYEKITRND